MYYAYDKRKMDDIVCYNCKRIGHYVTIVLLTKRHKKNSQNFPSLIKEAITEEMVIKVTEKIDIIKCPFLKIVLKDFYYFCIMFSLFTLIDLRLSLIHI